MVDLPSSQFPCRNFAVDSIDDYRDRFRGFGGVERMTVVLEPAQNHPVRFHTIVITYEHPKVASSDAMGALAFNVS
ncbi:Uncharacterised protein [Mycobacteroides abscessus subsp. abscessus]|nr:Uncharacterised protein [Mycobacteroides abscessus subsp. abscessus]